MVTKHAPWLKTLPSWLYKAGAQAWIDREYPRHLFIETTASCNLSCEYCPRERRGNHLPWELFTQVVDEAVQYGGRSFSLHLFGEPLLYPKIMEAIQYIKRAHKRNVVLLTTNGTRLNQVVADLIHANPDLVLWSWRPEVTFTAQTKAKLRAWGKFRVRFIQEVTPKEAYEEWDDWPNVEGRNLHTYGGNIDLSKFNTSPTPGNGTTAVNGAARWPCYHLWLAPAVAWNGDILLCCADPHHKEILGRFPETSVHEAWVSQKLQDVRHSHMIGNFLGICRNCDVWKSTPDLFFKWQKS